MRFKNQNHDIDELIDNGWNWTQFMGDIHGWKKFVFYNVELNLCHE
jgi:hypothetical protein